MNIWYIWGCKPPTNHLLYNFLGHPSTTGCEPKKWEELIGLGKRNLEKNYDWTWKKMEHIGKGMVEHGKMWKIWHIQGWTWKSMETFMNIPDREMLQYHYEGVRFSFPAIQVPSTDHLIHESINLRLFRTDRKKIVQKPYRIWGAIFVVRLSLVKTSFMFITSFSTPFMQLCYRKSTPTSCFRPSWGSLKCGMERLLRWSTMTMIHWLIYIWA